MKRLFLLLLLISAAALPLHTCPLTARAAENCITCHNGSDPDAPDVYRFWDGSFWGADSLQKGGHGDPGGLPARTCAGTLGCHDINNERHGNGILETAGNPAANTSLLRSIFISTAKDPASAVAEKFNTACATTCHPGQGVGICIGDIAGGHDTENGIPYTPRFGFHLTPEDADGSGGPRITALWLDSDISQTAAKADPDYALCVSCHDPHGTGIVEPQRDSNRMVREQFIDNISGYDHLCLECHASLESPPSMPSSVAASDGLHNDRVVISWTDVPGEDGYRIYRAAEHTGPYRIIATRGADQITFVDGGMACGEVYFYRVSSYRGGFESALTDWEIGSPCTPATGGITGTVASRGGSPLGGVDLMVYSGPSSVARSTRSSADGSFAAYGLAAGTYRVLLRGERIQYGNSWYGAAGGYESAIPIAVRDEQTATGVDAVLTARGDWNGDDRPDIFWQNIATGETRLWLMKGRVRLQSAPFDAMPEKGWEAAAVSDFNGDGGQDIFWRNYLTGRNTIWFTDGSSVIARAKVKRVGDTSWRVAAAGDINGDGMTDLLWRNSATGRSVFSLLNGSKLQGLLPAPQLTDTSWKAGTMTDFNRDGHVDIFWRNTVTGENMLWIMTEQVRLLTFPLQRVAVLSWELGQTGDFNGDGNADMVWRNYAAGANIIAHFDDGDLLGIKGIPKEKDRAWRIIP